MAAHRKLDRRRAYVCAGGFRQRAWKCTAVRRIALLGQAPFKARFLALGHDLGGE
jgi:hypothetical protein